MSPRPVPAGPGTRDCLRGVAGHSLNDLLAFHASQAVLVMQGRAVRDQVVNPGGRFPELTTAEVELAGLETGAVRRPVSQETGLCRQWT